MSTAHLYLLELGPELSHEDVDFLTYDDATQQLLVVKGGHVFAYDVSGGPAGHSSLKWMYPLQEGPRVLAMRPSLDNRMLALQRSPALLELVDLASGLCFVHSIHQGRGDILAFFFTDAPETDLVVVTSRAVELTQFAAKRQGLRCRERVRVQAAWARYTHETRMVLVGAAAAPRSALSAWQFASHGIVHIPLFELQGLLPASAAVRQFLPSPAAPAADRPVQAAAAAAATQEPAAVAHGNSTSSILAAAVAGAAAGGEGGVVAPARVHGVPHKQLNPDRLWLLKMYGRVYLAHVDAAEGRLELYRFYTDTIILEHVLDLFSPQVQLSVVDNTLVVHHPETAVAVLFDVALQQHKPLANPLPLRRLQLLPPDLAAAAAAELQQQQQQVTTAAAAAAGGDDSDTASSSGSSAAAAAAGSSDAGVSRGGSFSSISRTRAGFRRTLITVPARDGSAAAAAGSTAAAAVYESSEVLEERGWVFFPPNIVLDRADKTVGRLQLDLQAVIDSAEEWPSVVGFLLRRRPLPPTAPLAADPRPLLMQVVRAALQERVGLDVLRAIFDKLLQAYTDAITRAAFSAPARAAAAAAGHAAGSNAAAAASGAGLLDVPAVVILTPSELSVELFQWVHDEEVVDALYLQAAVSEFCAASEAVGVPPPAYLQLLTVDLLLQQEQHYQAVQLLYSQPGGTSSLAQHLLEKAGKDTRQPGGPSGASLTAVGGPAAAAAAGTSVARQGTFDVASPSSAMALELALDVMTRQAVPELRPVGPNAAAAAAAAVAGAASIRAASPAGGNSGSGSTQQSQSAVVQKASTAALVQQLLSLGEVLKAARVARTAGGVMALGIPAVAFLEVAAAGRDLGTLAAVYRLMRPHVVDRWPDFEAVRQELCGAAAVAR